MDRPKYFEGKSMYYRKQGLDKLFKVLKVKLFIDMSIAKRFRIWQILVLKRKISNFMRKVKETNKRFLQRCLKIIIDVLKKPLKDAFGKLMHCELKAQVSMNLLPYVAACKLSLVSVKLLGKSCSASLLSKALNPSALKSKAFLVWKARAYRASPFLQRERVLTLSVMAITLKHRWQHLSFAWTRLVRMSGRVETIPLCTSLVKTFSKNLSLAFRRLINSRPQAKRRQISRVDPENMKKKVKTSAILLEMMIEKRKAVEIKSLEVIASKTFMIWKRLCGESSVPNFIMKRQCRGWSIKIFENVFRYHIEKVKREAFQRVYCVEKHAENAFQVDKFIIENQANVMVRLESQHYSKLKEMKALKRAEKLNKCRLVFWRHFQKAFVCWKSILNAPENLEVRLRQVLFEYLRELESQAEDGQKNVELTEVRAIIERRSIDNVGRLIDSDSSINFRSL